jgi:hypothetical protein
MYPVIVEPTLRLRMQNYLWAIGYGVFVLAAGLAVVADGGEKHRRPPCQRHRQHRVTRPSRND